jgi:hypothetical protein
VAFLYVVSVEEEKVPWIPIEYHRYHVNDMKMFIISIQYCFWNRLIHNFTDGTGSFIFYRWNRFIHILQMEQVHSYFTDGTGSFIILQME